jgi:ELWxxDGT repeat protein
MRIILLLFAFVLLNESNAQPRIISELPNYISSITGHKDKVWLFGIGEMHIVEGDQLKLTIPLPGTAIKTLFTNDKAYFIVSSGNDQMINKYFLYESDGTLEGTKEIINLFKISSLTALSDKILFVGNNQEFGDEPWVYSNGIATILKDINPGPTGSIGPKGIKAGANYVYFPANDNEHGREFWKTDGTVAGTAMIRDLVPGPSSLQNFGFLPLHSTLYCILSKSVPNQDNQFVALYKWEENDTVSIVDFPLESGFRDLNSIGDHMWLSEMRERESNVYLSDGTKEGTKIIFSHHYEQIVNNAFTFGSNYVFQPIWVHAENPKDLQLESVDKQTYTHNQLVHFPLWAFGDFVALNDYLFYTAERQEEAPWQTEESDLCQTYLGKTKRVSDLFPEQSFNFNGIKQMTVSNGKLYFINQENLDSGNPYELWVYNPDAIVNGNLTSSSNSIKVFPNPVTDHLTLEIPNQQSKLSLIDIMGTEVFNQTVEEGRTVINLKDLNIATGVYFLKLELEGKIETYKIVKK